MKLYLKLTRNDGQYVSRSVDLPDEGLGLSYGEYLLEWGGLVREMHSQARGMPALKDMMEDSTAELMAKALKHKGWTDDQIASLLRPPASDPPCKGCGYAGCDACEPRL